MTLQQQNTEAHILKVNAQQKRELQSTNCTHN